MTQLIAIKQSSTARALANKDLLITGINTRKFYRMVRPQLKLYRGSTRDVSACSIETPLVKVLYRLKGCKGSHKNNGVAFLPLSPSAGLSASRSLSV